MKLRAFGGALLVVGAVLGAVGTFFPLYGLVDHIGPGYEYVITSWSDASTAPGGTGLEARGTSPFFGVPVVAGAGLLLIGVALAFTRGRWGATGRLTSALGAAVLAGTTGTAATVVESVFRAPLPEGDNGVERYVGVGTWTLAAASAVALTGAVLVQVWPPRPRPALAAEPAPAVGVEPETSEPGTAEPETAEPETAEPEIPEPETAEPEIADEATAEVPTPPPSPTPRDPAAAALREPASAPSADPTSPSPREREAE
ncbi:hypothetical protein [Actinosynnema sp. NPDC020468]|uniref:hypothetical protein n=1 Tax=Actinosynnema sp. NPDC020468 TaxID=3154488 RepID=UPI0033CB4E49